MSKIKHILQALKRLAGLMRAGIVSGSLAACLICVASGIVSAVSFSFFFLSLLRPGIASGIRLKRCNEIDGRAGIVQRYGRGHRSGHRFGCNQGANSTPGAAGVIGAKCELSGREEGRGITTRRQILPPLADALLNRPLPFNASRYHFWLLCARVPFLRRLPLKMRLPFFTIKRGFTIFNAPAYHRLTIRDGYHLASEAKVTIRLPSATMGERTTEK